LGYAVYAVDDCGEKEGGVLATVDSLDVGPTETCCEPEMYGATITSVLGAGVTQQAYMVVPVTSIGALDAGWTTAPVIDSTQGSQVVNRAVVSEASLALEGIPQSDRVKVPEQIQELTKIALSMTMNVDYQQLTSDDKDDFKGKVRDILVESVNDPQAVIVVMLTPGSVKVHAEIQTPNKNSAESVALSMKNNLDSLAQNVVEAANSVPGVKAAAFGELKVTRVEVKTVKPEERVSEAQDSSIGNSLFKSEPTSNPQRNPQPSTEGEAPGAPDEAQDKAADEDESLWQQTWFIMVLCAPAALVFLYILYAIYQKWAKEALKNGKANVKTDHRSVKSDGKTIDLSEKDGDAPVAPAPPPADAAPTEMSLLKNLPHGAYEIKVAPEEPAAKVA